MPYTLLDNKPNGNKVTIHVVAANSGDIIVVGNNTVSNLTSNASEIIAGAVIRRVQWSTDSPWTIKRGANTVIVLGTGHNDLRFHEMSAINLYPTANISANTAAATANSFLLIEISKSFSAYANTQY